MLLKIIAVIKLQEVEENDIPGKTTTPAAFLC